VLKVFELIIAMKPERAQEMGFLEIRMLGLKVKAITSQDKPEDEQIQSIYNQEFLNQIKLWMNVVGNNKNPLQSALVHLLMNTLKVSSHLKYNPFHLQIFALLNQLA